MSLQDKQRGLSSPAGAKPVGTPSSQSKPAPAAPKSTSVFGNQQYVRTAQAKRWLEKDPEAYNITKRPPEKRSEIWNRAFEKKDFIKPGGKDFQQAIKNMEKERGRPHTPQERLEIDRDIQILRRMMGK